MILHKKIRSILFKSFVLLSTVVIMLSTIDYVYNTHPEQYTVYTSNKLKTTTMGFDDIKYYNLDVSDSVIEESASDNNIDEVQVPEIINEKGVELDVTNDTISLAPNDVISPYEGYITKYMDLSKRQDITALQMNVIINYWLAHDHVTESELKNTGLAFIEASNETGYDPIFLLALAANESGWDVSDLHVRKNNPYSINMIDADPEMGYTLGDTFEEGIINGAIWIRSNYYDEGYRTLYEMIYEGKQYATAQDIWIDTICSIMDTSYKIINKNN